MSRADLLRALGACVVEPPERLATIVDALGLDRAPTRQETTELFSFQLYPYGSVYLGPEGKLGGVARDRTAGFLRALEIVPPPEPDHLTVLVDAYAQLADLDDSGTGRARHARRVLLHEHLLSWVPRFCERAGELGDGPLREWSGLLRDALFAEAELVGAAETLPAHFVDVPGFDDYEDGVDACVEAILAPVRSGLVLARGDLVRASRQLEVGLRVGERAYALKAMLEQRPRDVLEWLAGEARRQRGLVTDLPALGPAPGFWIGRLERTVDVLSRLARGRGPITVDA